MPENEPTGTFTRRRFLATAAAGVSFGAAGLLGARDGWSAPESAARSLTFGLVTDVHYADAQPGGSRHYRDSSAKLQEAIDTFNRREVAFVAESGGLSLEGFARQKDFPLATAGSVPAPSNRPSSSAAPALWA